MVYMGGYVLSMFVHIIRILRKTTVTGPECCDRPEGHSSTCGFHVISVVFTSYACMHGTLLNQVYKKTQLFAQPYILCPWVPIWSTLGIHVDQMGAHGHKMQGPCCLFVDFAHIENSIANKIQSTTNLGVPTQPEWKSIKYAHMWPILPREQLFTMGRDKVAKTRC